ncbi:hypothetical protein D1872_295970 [compost metagenome]
MNIPAFRLAVARRGVLHPDHLPADGAIQQQREVREAGISLRRDEIDAVLHLIDPVANVARHEMIKLAERGGRLRLKGKVMIVAQRVAGEKNRDGFSFSKGDRRQHTLV